MILSIVITIHGWGSALNSKSILRKGIGLFVFRWQELVASQQLFAICLSLSRRSPVLWGYHEDAEVLGSSRHTMRTWDVYQGKQGDPKVISYYQKVMETCMEILKG